jgi:hypothetical protein
MRWQRTGKAFQGALAQPAWHCKGELLCRLEIEVACEYEDPDDDKCMANANMNFNCLQGAPGEPHLQKVDDMHRLTDCPSHAAPTPLLLRQRTELNTHYGRLRLL